MITTGNTSEQSGAGPGPNRYTTFEEWDEAVTAHRWAADSLLTEALGWADNENPDSGTRRLDPATATTAELRAWVGHYLPRIREWDSNRPEWVR